MAQITPAGDTAHTLPRMEDGPAGALARALTCMISSRLRPGDRQALLDLFERSSPRSRQDRFHHALSVFPRRYLEDILAGRQLAVVARDTCHPDTYDRVFGLASAAPAGDGEAEFAVWVDDTWRHRGVGSLLARGILRRLAEQGIAVAFGIIEPGNVAARRLVTSVAPEAVTSYEDGVIVVRVSLAGWDARRRTGRAGAAR
jgi:GNAT superfamily N-acetyltransferase